MMMPQRLMFRAYVAVNNDCCTKGDLKNVCMNDQFVCLHNMVAQSKTYNFEGLQILVPSNLNSDFRQKQLCSYEDRIIVDFFAYGWPIGYSSEEEPISSRKNPHISD